MKQRPIKGTAEALS